MSEAENLSVHEDVFEAFLKTLRLVGVGFYDNKIEFTQESKDLMER